MSNTYPDGAPQTPYGDPNNAAGAEGAPEPQPTQAFPPVPVVPLPGQGAGAPTGAPAAPYGQGGAPYGAPTAAYGESLAGPQGGAEPYGYQAAPYGQEPGAYGQSGAGSPTFSSARFSPHIAEAKHFSSRCFVSHNKHTARQLFLQKLPGGMFLFMTIECSQSVHSIVSSIHKSS